MKLAVAGLVLLLTLLPGCSDWYSEPVMLADQESLSNVYEDRPMYSSLVYEGKYTFEDQEVHVFIMRVISKFTSQSSNYVYFLPVAQMEISTDVGRYQGEDKLKRTHRLAYEHDKGQFSLSTGNRKVELIPANFTEPYSFKESRCLKAIEEASNSPRSYPLTKHAAETCFWSGNYDRSRAFTVLLKDNMDTFDRYTTKGQMLHDYHTLMGRNLVVEGEIQEANRHLLQSIDVSPSPVMTSFGPNMELALDLLKAAQTDAVLSYLDACAGFWEEEPIRIWKQKIQQGRIPALNQYKWDDEVAPSAAAEEHVARPFQRNSESVVRVMSWNITLNSILPPDGVRQDAFIRIVRALEPDVIGIQEAAKTNADQLTALMDQHFPLSGMQSWSVHMVGDNALISRYPFTQKGGKRVVPFPVPQEGFPDFHFGFAAAHIDLPEAISDRDLYVITMHNKSGSSDENIRMRQVLSDAIVQWIRNLKAAESPGPIAELTPLVLLGDMNVVPTVSIQPYETLITGDIVDEETFGPDVALDWDDTGLADAMPSLNGQEESYYTWRNDELDFLPGALDRILFSDSVMSIEQKFVLDTTTMSGSDLSALGLQHSDVLYEGKIGVYDHLPIFADFVLQAVPTDP